MAEVPELSEDNECETCSLLDSLMNLRIEVSWEDSFKTFFIVEGVMISWDFYPHQIDDGHQHQFQIGVSTYDYEPHMDIVKAVAF